MPAFYCGAIVFAVFFDFLAAGFFAGDFLLVVDFFAFAFGAALFVDAGGVAALVASTLAGAAAATDGADD